MKTRKFNLNPLTVPSRQDTIHGYFLIQKSNFMVFSANADVCWSCLILSLFVMAKAMAAYVSHSSEIYNNSYSITL